MNRPGLWLLLGVVLTLLLAAQPQAAGAAIPPLKGVNQSLYHYNNGYRVLFSVWDPSRQEYRYGESRLLGDSPEFFPSLDPNSIVVQDGIVAWVGVYPSFSFVECAIYDPGPGEWKILEVYSPNSGVEYAYGLTIQNGVVSWTGQTKPKYPVDKYYQTPISHTTYDPQRGSWITKSDMCLVAFPNLQNKDGIIAYRTSPSRVAFAIYDPECSEERNTQV